MADVLELVDAEANAWLSGQTAGPSSASSSDRLTEEKSRPLPSRARPPTVRREESTGEIHLLLGCSIAKRACFSVSIDDMLVDRARSGNTWGRQEARLGLDLQRWRGAAATFGLRPGSIVIWMSGNEAYDRHTGANTLGERRGPLEEAIHRVLGRLRAAATSVVVLGPLPRFYVDRLLRWESTAAYRLDRKVKEASRPGEFVCLGKSLTKKLSGHHVVVEGTRGWFAEDGIHISPEGYRKIAAVTLFPRWLRMG